MMRIAIAMWFVMACGGPTTGGNGDDDGPGGDDAPTVDAPGTTACGFAPTCTAWNVASTCGVDEVCAGGCYAGACVADACADECTLGTTGARGTCKLWNMASSEFVASRPSTSMHDRSRDYDRRQQIEHLPEGGVLGTFHETPSLTKVVAYDSIVDSALWTGSLLAAQSWRHLVTRSADSASRIAALATTLHTWFNLAQSKGYLARFAASEAHANRPYNLDCARFNVHCDAVFDGVTYRWRGDTSRDSYTGVMLGLMHAYLATPDPAVRAAIRDDVVEFVEELMIERKDVPVKLTLNGLPIETTLDTKFLILAPEEMTNGRITIEVDSGDVAGGDLAGGREFVPDAGEVFGQLIGNPGLQIPRSGSAIMLGAFYRMALAMTEGVPEFATRRAAIAADYAAELERLISIGSQWSYPQDCGAKYYATHIESIMAYLWTVLETDPATKARLREQIMGTFWSAVDDHNNPYFALLNAGTRPGYEAEAASAVSQLAQFPAGPRVHAPRDNVAKYPHDPDCSDGGFPMSSVAVDVGDRVVSEFQWQRHPWRLYDPGSLVHIAPGVDFLAAYWLGRYHDFLPDDRAGTCTRWAE